MSHTIVLDVYLSSIASSESPIQFFTWRRLYLVCFQASLSIPFDQFHLTTFIQLKLDLKFTIHLYKISYYLYLVRSGERCELADLRVRKSNPILQLVQFARAAVAKAYASLTAFCLHTIAYYILAIL